MGFDPRQGVLRGALNREVRKMKSRWLLGVSAFALAAAGVLAGPTPASAQCVVDTFGAPSPDTIECSGVDGNGATANSFDANGVDIQINPGAAVIGGSPGALGNDGITYTSASSGDVTFNMPSAASSISGVDNGVQVLTLAPGTQDWTVNGSITGGNDGVNIVATGGTINFNIGSTGDIRGGDDGVDVFTGGSFDGTNAGMVVGGDDGFDISAGNTASLDNSGTVIGVTGNGISLGSINDATVTNSGEVTGGNDGINVTSVAGNASVTNSGMVDAGNDGVVATALFGNAELNNDGGTINAPNGVGFFGLGGTGVEVSNVGGTIDGGTAGIFAAAGNNNVEINNTNGSISGDDGIIASALDPTPVNPPPGPAEGNVEVTNDGGSIVGVAGTGITAGATRNVEVNNFSGGTISGTTVGIFATADRNVEIKTGGASSSISGGTIGILAVAGNDVEIDNTDGGLIDGGAIGILAGATNEVVINNTNSTIDGGAGLGITSVSGTDTAIDNTDGLIQGGVNGIAAIAGNDFSATNTGGTIDGGTGVGLASLSINDTTIVNNDGGVISGDTGGVLAISGNNIDFDNQGGTVNSLNGIGIAAFAADDITITGTGGQVNSGGTGILAIAGGSVDVASGTVTSTNGSGVIAGSLLGGDANVTVDGKISADNGLFGAAAFSLGGEATVDVDADIDPPLIGAFAGTIGAGDATVNVADGVSVTADAIGAQAFNIGAGSANVTVGNGSTVDGSQAPGLLGVGIGALDFGQGGANVSVGNNSQVLANGGDALSFGIGAASLFSGVGNPDADVNINVGQNSVVDAQGAGVLGVGIAAAKFQGEGDINIEIGQGSQVTGEHLAIAAVGGSIGTDNDINIQNAGIVTSNQAGAAIPIPTIFALTDGDISIDNESTGVIGSAAQDSDLIISATSLGNTVQVDNAGTMSGRVALLSAQNTLNNSGQWNTSGLSIFGINPNDAVNNTGTVQADGVTTFLGLENFNNAGGILSMQDFAANDVTTIVSPFNGGNFNGGPGSVLAIDAALNGPGFGPPNSDLLLVGNNITGQTAVNVNDLLAGTPGTFNPTGITFAAYGNDASDAQGAFFLQGGPIDKGLFSYDVFQDDNRDPFGIGTGGEYILASTPDATFFELPSIVTGAQQLWHTTSGVWLDRTADLRSSLHEVCSGGLKDEICTQTGVAPGGWVKVLGSTSDRSPDQQSFSLLGRTFTYDTSYQQDTYGVLAGLDYGETRGNESWLVGVFGGYVGSDLDFDNSTTNVDYQTGVVGAYATYIQGGFFADGKIMAQFGDVDYSSSAQQGITANDSADLTSIGGVLDAGYRAQLDGATFIEPGATLAYVNADVDDLAIFGHTAQFGDDDSLRGRLGVRLGTTLVDMGTKYEPFVGVSAWQKFSADNSASVVSNGVTLTANDDAEGTIGEVSLGLNIFDTTGSGVSGFIKGDAQFGENDFEAYSGNAGFRVKF